LSGFTGPVPSAALDKSVFSWYVQYSIIASSDCQEEYHSF
jgi:hypothetical protein